MTVAWMGLAAWAPAGTSEWGNVNGGNWKQSSNWVGNDPPDQSDTVRFGHLVGNNIEIRLNGNKTVDELEITTAANFTIKNNVLTLQDGDIRKTGGSTGTTTITSEIHLHDDGLWDIQAGMLALTGPVTGTADIEKRGSGTLLLSGASSYVGETKISGGTLLLGASNVIPNNSQVSLNGGRLAMGSTGFDDRAGVFVLQNSSVIDFGNGTQNGQSASSVLTFATTNFSTWSGTLSIWNWTGGALQDQLIFLSHTGSPLPYQVQFYSDNGITPIGTGGVFQGNQLVPVPEASTVMGVLALVGLVGWRERRHFLRCPAARGGGGLV